MGAQRAEGTGEGQACDAEEEGLCPSKSGGEEGRRFRVLCQGAGAEDFGLGGPRGKTITGILI